MSIRPGRAAVPTEECAHGELSGFGIIWAVAGFVSDGRFSVVHHPLAPKALAAPLHRHSREDEYSYVVSGTMGALLGEEVVISGPRSWVYKPRDQWHTFWNDGDTPCEIIEIISPAGFEDFFHELVALYSAGDGPDLALYAALCERYGLDMDPTSVPGLCARFGLTHPLA